MSTATIHEALEVPQPPQHGAPGGIMRRLNIVTGLISGVVLALVVYWTFPVAPPRYLPEWGFVDTMQQYANLSYQAQSLAPFVNLLGVSPAGRDVQLAVYRDGRMRTVTVSPRPVGPAR